MQDKFTRSVTLLLLLLLTFPLVAQLEDPPVTLVDGIRSDNPTVQRAFFDDEIVLYTGGNYTAGDVTWMIDHIREVWQYMKANYGDFGDDPRIYAVVHSDPAYRSATINTRFDAGFGYRNTINLGGAWEWRDSTADVNIDVITHELAHIVEGGNNQVKESPSFEFWADGPWPEIFQYDIYLNANKDADRAQRWFNRSMRSTNTHFGPNGGKRYFFFRDWFYPLWRDNGGVAFYDRYFEVLSEHFRQQPINDPSVPDSIPTSAFRANFGEILYFTNLASGKDNKQLFTDAFGWDDAREEELLNARYYYDTEEIGDTIEFPDYLDITDGAPGGLITSEFSEDDSPATEQLPNIIDGSYLTKWLTFNPAGWLQYESDNRYVVSAYTLTSANDASERDPVEWNLQGSNDGENWTTIDERNSEDFIVRFYQRLFTFENDVAYSHYRFNFSTVGSTITQIAEMELLTTENAVSVFGIDNTNSLKFNIYPNPAGDRLYLERPDQFTKGTIRVFSAQGRQLLIRTGSLDDGIDTSGLPPGSYSIQLEDGGKSGTRKFLKR